jgi:hypothetical protein
MEYQSSIVEDQTQAKVCVPECEREDTIRGLRRHVAFAVCEALR